jgi:hypothetical protein
VHGPGRHVTIAGLLDRRAHDDLAVGSGHEVHGRGADRALDRRPGAGPDLEAQDLPLDRAKRDAGGEAAGRPTGREHHGAGGEAPSRAQGHPAHLAASPAPERIRGLLDALDAR